MDQSKLEEGKFLCVIPRWRWSPFWKMRNDPVNLEKEKIDQAYKIPDQQYLLEAIIEVIRQTDMKILICPEDLSQIELGRETLYNPLPDNIKKRVVLREQFLAPRRGDQRFQQECWSLWKRNAQSHLMHK